jgi:selenocysteine lyase/cysteine desulfurase
LARIPAVRVYGPNDPTATIGVASFTVGGVVPGLVAAILGYEHGIGVRSGCFCAHPYIAHLLGLDGPAARRWAERARGGERVDLPGLVRVSFGFYNHVSDVDRLLDAVERIAAGDVAGTYRPDRHGEYRPVTPMRVTAG